MTIPRRIRLDLATPPEVAIRAAIAAVEALTPDSRLTQALGALGQALDHVSTYVDEKMRAVDLGANVWCAFILYEPARTTRLGIYASKEEADVAHPGWRDAGYVLAPCDITTGQAR